MKRIIFIALALLVAIPLGAQQLVNQPTGTIFGRVDFGIQPVTNTTNSSKFTEYRQFTNGTYIPYFHIFGDEALRYDFLGENARQNDAHYRLALIGSQVRVTLDFNSIVHNFGNDAQTIFVNQGGGVLTVDDAIQAHCQTEVVNALKTKTPINYPYLSKVLSEHLQNAATIDLGLIRRIGTMELRTPAGSPYDVRFTYLQENRSGNRPFGTSFGFGNAIENPEPIDYTTRQVGTAAEYPFSHGLLRASAQYDDFNNALTSLTFDNPFRITDSTHASAYSAPSSTTVDGAATGRMALAPSNRSLTGAVGATFNLPAKSQLTADVSLSHLTQNAPFIAFTTNSAIPTPELPEPSLNGKVDVKSGTIAFVSHPIKNLTVTARTRMYDFDNGTRRIELPGYVRFDAVWEEIERISVPYTYRTNRSDLNVVYDFGRFDLEGGYRNERWNRRFREVNHTNEGVWRIAGDFRPFTAVLLRTSYERGSRSIDGYDNVRGGGASFVDPESSNLPSLRRYDEAAKDLNRVGALLQFTPGDVTFSINYLATHDDYNQSQHGLLNAKNSSITAEADWSPADRVNVYGFASRDSYTTFQLSRQSGATPSTNPLDNWSANVSDKASSLGFGSNLSVVPDKVDFRVVGSWQTVNGNNDLFSPAGGTPDFAVGIRNFDDTRLWSGSAEFDYKINPTWNVIVGGLVEKYDIADAATSGLVNYMPAGLFLVPNNGAYRGRVFYIKTSYRR